MVGDVGLFLPKKPEDEGDLGFQFHPAGHGRGYAREAAEALIRHGFLGLRLRRITAGCDADNAASRRLIERLGMERLLTKGEGLAYALTREAWLALSND